MLLEITVSSLHTMACCKSFFRSTTKEYETKKQFLFTCFGYRTLCNRGCYLDNNFSCKILEYLINNSTIDVVIQSAATSYFIGFVIQLKKQSNLNFL